MNSSERILRALLAVYLVLFFAFMFIPLIYMMIVTFNISRIPTLSPWRGFTVNWFAIMWNDQRMWQALTKSIIIGLWVIVISVPLGLAGAFLMVRIRMPGKSLIYAILVSPVLMPGIIIGLSTLIFWDRTFHIGGQWPLSVLGQASFISAYCMLLFTARLQRFDTTLEEAALDLGATPFQVFWTVTAPYMRPALISASALAFMQSFENYNTTLFTIGNDFTLTMFIAGKVRTGVTPALNALGFIMVVATIVAGIAYEIARRREEKRRAARLRAAAEADMALVGA